MTINLKGVNDNWFDVRQGALIDGLLALAPDVLCLQETTIRHSLPIYHQARDIGQAIGLFHVAFSPYGNSTEILSERDHGGIAILSRWPIADVRGRRLPCGHMGQNDARTALLARLDSPQGSLGVITSHLSWRPEEAEVRLLQLGILLQELERAPWGANVTRCIFAGDLNATSVEPVIRAANSVMTDTFAALHPNEPGYTWSKRNPFTEGQNLPDRRIDYIFCDREAKVLRAEVVLNEPAPVFPSDHFGVLADLEWAGEP